MGVTHLILCGITTDVCVHTVMGSPGRCARAGDARSKSCVN
jgi:hypothetical protein